MYIPTDDFASPEDEYKELEARARAAARDRLDEIAYEMDRTYGSRRAAERLGVSQQVINRRRNRHKERFMTRTVTVHAPGTLEEVTREWEPVLRGPSPVEAYRTFTTRDSQGRRLVLERVDAGPGRAGHRWELVHAAPEDAGLDAKLEARRTRADLKGSATLEGAVVEATRYLHEHPAGPDTAPEPTYPDTETYICTQWVPVLREEVTVAWNRTKGTWEAEVDGRTWTAGVDRYDDRTGRRVWAYGTGPDRAEYQAGANEEAHQVLAHLAWDIAIRPRVEDHHRAARNT